ncbi:uncharacterized protein ACBT57_012876 isoform 2-T8 [Dama dama]
MFPTPRQPQTTPRQCGVAARPVEASPPRLRLWRWQSALSCLAGCQRSGRKLASTLGCQGPALRDGIACRVLPTESGTVIRSWEICCGDILKPLFQSAVWGEGRGRLLLNLLRAAFPQLIEHCQERLSKCNIWKR